MTTPNPRLLRSARYAAASTICGLSLISGALHAGTYNQNYNAFANGTTGGNLNDGSIVSSNTGVASVQNQRLRLTANGTGNSNAAYRLPVLDPGFEVAEFTMDFDLTLFETAGGNNPADGFSINFGAIPTLATDYGPGEEGWALPNSLVIAFDTWDNGGEPPAIEAKADSAPLQNVAMGTLAPGGNFLNLFDNVSRHVSIHWDINGLDLTYGGQAVFTNLPTPGFVPSIGNYFAFSGRTGGAFEDVIFDNMVVTTVQAAPLETGGPIISEFLANNVDNREDEDCEPGAWIEIYNGQNAAVNLTGWHLTNNVGNPTLWPLPAIALGPYAHVLIWADGKNRTTAPNYHAGFTLATAGGYLALRRPDSSVATAYTYGPQAPDISFGTLGIAQTQGYFENPSPGVKNSGVQSSAPPTTEEVEFSRVGGLITGPVTLNVTPPVGAGAVIRYNLNNEPPSTGSALWPAGGITITDSTNVRARVFEPGKLPGPVSTRGFILLDPTVANYRGSGQPFTSNLPIVVFHSFGNNIDAQTGSPGLRAFRYTYGVAIDVDPNNGNRASLTGPIDFQGRGGVHVRGETSAGFPQRPYSWELWDNEDGDKDSPIFGLSSDSDWAFISNYNDKALIRNIMPFDTMYELNGEGSAMREKYVEVFFKQTAAGPITYADYRGVYCFTERIKRHDDRVNIDKLEPCDNVRTGNPAIDDVATISGGYIFRKDKDPQINPITIGSAGGFQIYEPDPPTAEQLNYIRDYLLRFDGALNGPGFGDPVNGYAKYIDVPSFIDIHLWVEIYKQIDGYRLSSYFYKDRGKKVRSAPLWDYNLCIGNGSPQGGYPATFEQPTSWYYSSNSGAAYPWYARLFQDPEFTLQYWDRYWQLRRSMYTDQAVIADIERRVNLLSDNHPDAVIDNSIDTAVDVPVARHHDRWKRLGVYDWPNMTNFGLRTRWNSPVNPSLVTETTDPFQEISEIAFAKVWMLRRLMWMDDQSMTFNSTVRNFKPPFLTQYGGVVNSGYQLGITNPNSGSGQVVYYTTDGTDPRAGGGTPVVGLSGTLIDADTVLCDYLVPSTTNGGDVLTHGAGPNQWTAITDPVNNASWTQDKPMALGFRGTITTFDPFIETNVKEDMQPTGGTANGTIYVRVPFTITQQQKDTMLSLVLGMRYDDAYIAYLNGVEVIRKPANIAALVPVYNAVSGVSHADSQAIQFEDVDISAAIQHLQPGNNILAIHGLNATAVQNDFLLQPRMQAGFGAVVPLTQSVNFKARVFDTNNSLWSPLTDANFLINVAPASSSNVVVSEFHYNPLDPTPAEITAGANSANDFEYIEIMNISGGTVDLTDCRFTEGITFNWFDAPANVQTLGPGQRMIICENLAAFNMRYGGNGAVIAGTFLGNLGNAGETIRFVDKNNADIRVFTYLDESPWPKDADGGEYDGLGNLISGGYSAVLNNPLSNPDHNVGTNWRTSATRGGAPGMADSTPFTGSPTADGDGDGIPDLVEYACGSNPASGSQSHAQTVATTPIDVEGVVDTYLTFNFVRSLTTEGVNSWPEVSSTLATWENGSVSMVYVGSSNNGDGTATETWRSALPANQLTGRFFGRLRTAMIP